MPYHQPHQKALHGHDESDLLDRHVTIQEEGDDAIYSDFEIPVPSPVQQQFFTQPGRAPLTGRNKQQPPTVEQQEAGFSDPAEGSGVMAEEQPDVSFGIGHAEEGTETPAMLQSTVKLGKPSTFCHNALCVSSLSAMNPSPDHV